MSQRTPWALTALVVIVLVLQPVAARQPPVEGEIGGYITVRQGDSVAVLPGATVMVVRGDQRAVAVTDGSGRFAITSLPLGTYSVTVELVGFVPATGSVTLRPDARRAHLAWSLELACLDAVQRIIFDVQQAVTVADAVVHFRVASESEPVLWSGHHACAGAVNREYRAELLDAATRQPEVERHFYPLEILKPDARLRLHPEEEYLAYLVWQPTLGRFTFLGEELVLPVREGRIDAPGEGARDLNARTVAEALEMVRRWMSEWQWRRISQIGPVPADFAIRIAGGPCSGDGFDTADGMYRRFLLDNRRAETQLNLTAEMRRRLFQLTVDARFFEYPERFAPPTNQITVPSPRIAITVTSGGIVHTVRWVDVGETAPEAVRLRRFIRQVYEVLGELPEVQALPPGEGGCA